MKIDWHADHSDILVNPRTPEYYREHVFFLRKQVDNFHPGNLWFATSGSLQASTAIKWVGITRSALLHSAAAVNRHLQSSANDVWINPLPFFHVGGQSIYARAHLSGASVVSFDEWQPQHFYDICCKKNATLASLVPAQVYDLVVKYSLSAPPRLRAVVVGGGALTSDLYGKACRLGWPLLGSYGLTECASQVATSELADIGKAELPRLKPLDHVTLKESENGRLCIKSPALFSAYAFCKSNEVHFEDPRTNGWYQTEDRVLLLDDYLYMYGRDADFIKIGGESVNFALLQAKLEDLCAAVAFAHDCALVAYPDARLGAVIHICHTEVSADNLSKIMDAFNAQVMPFEKIRRVHLVEYIPRTSLRKLQRSALLAMIS